MDTDLQRHRLLDSLNGARFEDLLGDLHYCARCQIQFSTMYAFINHRTDSCHMMTRAGSEVTLNAVELQQLTVSSAAGSVLPCAEGSAGTALVSVPVLSASGTPVELLLQVPHEPAAEPTAATDQPDPAADAVTAAAPTKRPAKKRLRQRNHECDICGHRCAFPKDLVRHKFKHTKEKFRCAECGAAYSRPDKLAEHERLSHRQPEARRRLACHVPGCTFRAVSKYHVQKHVRDRHSDERPHSCQVCNYSAKHPHQLTVHLRSHTGDRPYPCQHADCGRSFRTGWDLRRHQLFHSGEQPFSCQRCSFTSAFRGNYYKHLRRIHGIDKEGNDISTTEVSQDTEKRRGTAVGRRGRGQGQQIYAANFWCSYCSCPFVRKEAYLVHLATHMNSDRAPDAVADPLSLGPTDADQPPSAHTASDPPPPGSVPGPGQMEAPCEPSDVLDAGRVDAQPGPIDTY